MAINGAILSYFTSQTFQHYFLLGDRNDVAKSPKFQCRDRYVQLLK